MSDTSGAREHEGLGERLRRLLEDRGMSQGKLGKLAGYHRTQVNKAVAGKRQPDEVELRAYAEVLSTSYEDLVAGLELSAKRKFGRVATLEARVAELEARIAELECTQATDRAELARSKEMEAELQRSLDARDWLRDLVEAGKDERIAELESQVARRGLALVVGLPTSFAVGHATGRARG